MTPKQDRRRALRTTTGVPFKVPIVGRQGLGSGRQGAEKAPRWGSEAAH
jgi:hypothetical protein